MNNENFTSNNSDKIIDLRDVNGNLMGDKPIYLPVGTNINNNKLITSDGKEINTNKYNVSIDLKGKKILLKKIGSNTKPFKISKEDIKYYALKPVVKLGKVGIKPWNKVNISNQNSQWIWTDKKAITSVPTRKNNNWSDNPSDGSQGIFYYVWYNNNSYKTVNIEAAMDDLGFIYVNNKLLHNRPLGGGWGNSRIPVYKNIKVVNGYNTFKFKVQNSGSSPNPAGLVANVSAIKNGRMVNLFNTGMDNWYFGKDGWKYSNFNDFYLIKINTNMNGGTRFRSNGWDNIYTQIIDNFGYPKLFNNKPVFRSNLGGIIRYENKSSSIAKSLLNGNPGWILGKDGRFRVGIVDKSNNMRPPINKNWIKRNGFATGTIFKVESIANLSTKKFNLKPAVKLGLVNIRPWNRTNLSNQRASWIWTDKKAVSGVPGNNSNTWSENPEEGSEKIFYYVWYNKNNLSDVNIEAMADNLAMIYINGKLVSTKPQGGGWGNSKVPIYKNIPVNKDYNIFQFRVQNIGKRPNPAGLAVNVYAINNNKKYTLFQTGMNGWYSGKEGWNYINTIKESKDEDEESEEEDNKEPELDNALKNLVPILIIFIVGVLIYFFTHIIKRNRLN